MKTVIVGSGPAGMAAASATDGDVALIEAEDEPGGLCRSFRVGRSFFDLGGHAFFTNDRGVEAMFDADGCLYSQPREAWVWVDGSTVRYPFQSHLYGLPLETVRDCLAGLAERTAAPDGPGDLRQFLLAQFGPGIVGHFLGPYNEKVWATGLDSIVPVWVGERVVQPPVADIVEGALRPRRYGEFPNARVRYPRGGGFASLFADLAARTEKVRTKGRVVGIDTAQRTVATSDGRLFGYDWLISTMPLDDLARCLTGAPPDVAAAAGDLAANSLLLVSLEVRSDRPDPRHRLYCADPTVPFHKVVLNHNSAPGVSPDGHKALQLEISYSARKPRPEGDPLEIAVAALRRTGLLAAGDEVTASDVRLVDRAYPIYTPAALAAKAHIIDWCTAHRILPVGRFGEWLYVNSDGAVRRGLDAAATVNSAGAVPLPPKHRAPGR